MQQQDKIERNPKYAELVHRRKRLGLILTALMLLIYFGFILLVAYQPALLAKPLAGGLITVGIPLGLFVILSAFVLTGIYVWRANAVFDTLTHEIVQETKQ